MKRNPWVLPILFALLMTGCAMQQDIVLVDDRLALLERRYSELDHRQVDLKNRLLEAEKTRASLESALQDLGKNRDVKEVDLRGQFAGLNSEVNAIRKEIQSLRGSIEETDFQLKQKLSGPEAEIAASNRSRIARIENYLNLEQGDKPGVAAASPARPEPGRPEVKTNPEEDAYSRAKQAFDKGDLETARNGFQDFLAKFPKSGNADNAQFWIGEVYYREKWYEKAILEYQKVIEAYPKGNKAPAALLKQGFAFLSLGDKSNARLILRELIKKHPDSNEGKIAVQKLKEIN